MLEGSRYRTPTGCQFISAAAAKDRKQKGSSKGFGKPNAECKRQQIVLKQRKVGGRATQQIQFLNQHNETKEEDLPSRTSGTMKSDPLPNSLKAMLLVGFAAEDAEKTIDFFASLDSELKIACCQEEHLNRNIADIFSAPHGLLQPDCPWVPATEEVPRAVILSGMQRKELLGIAEFWHLSGVQEPIFASAVPAVQTRQLRDVLREVVQAYAQNLDSHQAPLDSATLKSILRQKIASRH